MINRTIAGKIFERLSAKTKTPFTELAYINEFTFCVAVILSAQSTDKAVNKATSELFQVINTPNDMLALGEEKLKQYIKSIGLYNNKAKNILLLSKILVQNFNSTIPRDRDTLEKLPGIGRKSANVIVNNLFGKPYIAVDTHVLRVSNRLGLSDKTTPLGVENDLMTIVPVKYHKDASNLLVLHGRYICIAKKPKCAECIINDLCKSQCIAG